MWTSTASGLANELRKLQTTTKRKYDDETFPTTIHAFVDLLVRDRIGASKLGMKVRRIRGDRGERVVHLVIDDHVFEADVRQRDLAVLPKRHFPVAVECVAGIDANRQ
jgi:hypothetical protein